VILVVLRTSPSEYQGAMGFPLSRGISRGVVETRGRDDETTICTAFRLRPSARSTGRWTPCPAVISTRLRTSGPRLSSARSRLRACLAAARLSTLLASSSPSEPAPFAPAGKPASSRGVGVHQTVTRLAPALRPSADTSATRTLPVAWVVRPEPPSASRQPASKSRSALVVSHHLDGFLRATARRFVAPCCRPWGSPRFAS